jgi:hypothetical protein
MKLKDLDYSPLVLFTAFILVCILAGFLLLYALSPENKVPGPESVPSIYITRTDRFLDLNGETVWLLEYTIDGRFQSPAFHSLEAMAAYREYLDTIGKVYRREEEEHNAAE